MDTVSAAEVTRVNPDLIPWQLKSRSDTVSAQELTRVNPDLIPWQLKN